MPVTADLFPDLFTPFTTTATFSEATIGAVEKTLIAKNGKPYLKCLVRGKDVMAKPEEIVRQLSPGSAIQKDEKACGLGGGVIALEVLLTYLRLPIVCELVDLQTSASLYPAISERDIRRLPIPKNTRASRQANHHPDPPSPPIPPRSPSQTRRGSGD